MRPLPDPAPSLELDRDAMQHVTRLCTEFAIDHIESLPSQPSWDLSDATAIARSLRTSLPPAAAPVEELLDELRRAVSKSFNTAGPGYMAYVPGGGIYSAALGDYLALAVNRYVGMWNAAPALVEIESTAIEWLRELVSYAPGATGLLTSGGSMSNLIAVVTARRNRLSGDFSDAVIYRSEEAHHSLDKAALLAGFERENLHVVPVDARRRLDVHALQAAIDEDLHRGRKPFMVFASSGTTNTGAIDPVEPIADLCERHALWLHIDAAYGGFFRAASGGRELLPGLERADTLTLDPHKGLFLPYGTGCLLARDPEVLRKAHSIDAEYLQDLERPADALNFAEISPELSRDFRGLRLWFSLKLFGAEAFRAQLREKLELARWAYDELCATPGFECLDEPQLSIVAFRYRPKRELQPAELDELNRRLLERVLAGRRVFLSSTRIDGCTALRLCILSFRTRGAQVAMAIEELRRAAGEIEASGS